MDKVELEEMWGIAAKIRASLRACVVDEFHFIVGSVLTTDASPRTRQSMAPSHYRAVLYSDARYWSV
jgi:hypothetical protein